MNSLGKGTILRILKSMANINITKSDKEASGGNTKSPLFYHLILLNVTYIGWC